MNFAAQKIEDGDLTQLTQIGYRYFRPYAPLADDSNVMHEFAYRINRDDFTYATIGSATQKTLRNPKTGSNQTCTLIAESIDDDTAAILTVRHLYSPEFADIQSFGSQLSNLTNPSGLTSGAGGGQRWAASVQPFDKFRLYSARIAVSSIPDIADTVNTLGGSTTFSGNRVRSGNLTDTRSETTSGQVDISQDYNEDEVVTWSAAGVGTIWVNGTSTTMTSTGTAAGIEALLNTDKGVVSHGDNFLSIQIPEPDSAANGETFRFSGPSAGYAIEVVGNLSWRPIKKASSSSDRTDDDNTSRSRSGNLTDSRTETDSRSQTFNQTNTVPEPPSLRSITTSAVHGLVAGDLAPLWNNDELIAILEIVAAPTTTTLTVKISDLPGKEVEATHIGGSSSDYTEYFLRAPDVHTRMTYAFFIPGVTGSIATAEDITTVQGDDTPQEMLDALVAGDTWLQLQGSQLEQIHTGMYRRTVTEAKVADIFKSPT